MNEWTHVAAGVDGTNEIHFINGAFAEQDGCGGSLTINNDDFKIGARGGDGGHSSQFRGSVDEAMLFDSMLTDDEVQAIYEAYYMGACDDVDCGEMGSCVLGACECTSTLSIAERVACYALLSARSVDKTGFCFALLCRLMEWTNMLDGSSRDL